MLKNYIVVTFRNLVKNRVFSIINIFGLAFGLCSFLLIYFWVSDEYAIDAFHEKGDRLYQVISEIDNGSSTQIWTNTPGLLAEAISNTVSGVEAAIKVTHEEGRLIKANDKKIRKYGRYVDPEFFDLFNFPLAQGDARTALNDLNGIILSQELAAILFPEGDAMGNTLLLTDEQEDSFVVTGILAPIPPQSTLQFDFLISYDKYQLAKEWNKEWGNYNDNTYVLLAENADLQSVKNQVEGIIKANQEGSSTNLRLFPFQNLYLKSNFSEGLEEGGRINHVRMFTFVGFVILIIACINFMNLSTARAHKRAKEVGIRKATGAHRNLIIFQFLGESILITFLGLIVALTLADLLMPFFNELTGKQIAVPFSDVSFILKLACLGLITGILAGIYPAFYLSAFEPAAVLKGVARGANSLGGLRRILVIIQFAASIVFIIGTLIIFQQLNYVLNKDLGLKKDNVLMHRLYGVANHRATFRNELLQIPGVKQASYANFTPFSIYNTNYSVSWKGKEEESMIAFHTMQADRHIVETFEMELLEGRGFTDKVDTTLLEYIINEEALKVMNIKGNPIGEEVSAWGYPGKIVGVVKNFHHQSLFGGIDPVIIMRNEPGTGLNFVKIETNANPEQISAAIEQLYLKYEQEYPFVYNFLDVAYAANYKEIKTAGTLTNIFAFVAVLISCLGLFGLAAYMTEQRIKETGVRKVLGATVFQLTYMFTKDFVKLVSVAFLIGIPLAYFLLDQWLSDFVYRIEITILPFMIGGIIAYLIAILTVSFNTIRASRANPVQSLRYE